MSYKSITQETLASRETISEFDFESNSLGYKNKLEAALAWLGQDDNAEIRMAVVECPYTTPKILKVLQSVEADSDIQELITQRLEAKRTRKVNVDKVIEEMTDEEKEEFVAKLKAAGKGEETEGETVGVADDEDEFE